MAHPYKDHAHSSHKSKAHSMGHTNNLDIPVMRAAGENRAGGIHESSASMQHKKQAAAPGMKKGGKVKHHKAAPIMMPPPPPDPAAMAAAGAGGGGMPPPGAGGPPPGGAPPPAPGMPGMKKGGRVHKSKGGQAYPLHEAGGGGGMGRMQKAKAYGYPLDAGGKSGIGRLEKNHMGKPPFKAIKGNGE